MPFAGDQKDQVQQATDIVQLVSEHVALKQRGGEYVGLCPFHEDKNPSMYVSPRKQIFKCFACGMGGDVFTWQMKYHRLEFREALESLAERAGIQLEKHPGRSGSTEPGAKSNRQRLADANEKALAFFRHCLDDKAAGQIARDYLDRRGMHPDMIEAFQLGYAPDAWDALNNYARKMGWDLNAFEQAGLIAPRKSGQGCYDKLRHRLIFPICDAMGRPIAFGGRKLREEDNPKYLNSPETLLFNKSATLYGLHLAKKAIMDSHTAVIVEGYTDVIACHQAGAKNVLATLGTAFTAEHVKELRRFAEKVILVFDGDTAGQKAAERAVDIFMHAEVDVAIAILPEGKDPADLLAEEDGLEQWRQAMDAASSAMDFLFGLFGRTINQTDSVTGRQRQASQFISKLAELGLDRVDPVRRSLIVQRLATTLGMQEAVLHDMLLEQSKLHHQRSQRTPPPAATAPDDAPPLPPSSMPSDVDIDADLSQPQARVFKRAERDLIGCLLQDNQLFELTMDDGRSMDETVTPGDMLTAVGYQLYELIYNRLAEHQSATTAALAGHLSEQGRDALVDALTQADVDVEQRCLDDGERRQAMFLGAVQWFCDLRQEKEYRQAREQTQQSTAPPGPETPQTADSPQHDPAEDLRLKQLEDMLRSRRPSAARIPRTPGNAPGSVPGHSHGA